MCYKCLDVRSTMWGDAIVLCPTLPSCFLDLPQLTQNLWNRSKSAGLSVWLRRYFLTFRIIFALQPDCAAIFIIRVAGPRFFDACLFDNVASNLILSSEPSYARTSASLALSWPRHCHDFCSFRETDKKKSGVLAEAIWLQMAITLTLFISCPWFYVSILMVKIFCPDWVQCKINRCVVLSWCAGANCDLWYGKKADAN